MRWALLLCVTAAGCAHAPPAPADGVVIDRFGASAGHLQRRTAENHLPGPNEPVDFDTGPFITQSRGPGGEIIRYYNFDVQPAAPATLYRFVTKAGALVPGQRDVVAAIPGDAGYSDFVRLVRVVVPDGYAANTVRDAAEIARRGWPTQPTDEIYNRPIVPRGSVARERWPGGSTALVPGWYRGGTVQWLELDEAQLHADGDRVPTSPIYVTFNRNPGEPGGGPPAGFVTEPGTRQTHNVASSLPGDVDYSPLWSVSVYDRRAFPSVTNETTVLAAPLLARDVALVNCPIVFVESR